MFRFLRWFNSNPVFWTFMLGVVAIGDIFALWNWVTISPKDHFALASTIFITLVTVPVFLRMRKSR